MRGFKKQTVSKMAVAVSVFILLTMEVSARVYLNGANTSLLQWGGILSLSKGETLEDCSVEGAGYFLGSYSDFLVFLQKVEVAELSVLDYNEVQMDLNRAIEKMEYARDAFTRLKAKAEATPYNADVLSRLFSFNYDGFQEKRRLVKPVFDQVKGYLFQGNIREVYGNAIWDAEEILRIGNIIKAEIDAGLFPDLSSLWDLGQTCSKSLLFGQYVARVFYEINVK